MFLIIETMTNEEENLVNIFIIFSTFSKHVSYYSNQIIIYNNNFDNILIFNALLK